MPSALRARPSLTGQTKLDFCWWDAYYLHFVFGYHLVYVVVGGSHTQDKNVNEEGSSLGCLTFWNEQRTWWICCSNFFLKVCLENPIQHGGSLYHRQSWISVPWHTAQNTCWQAGSVTWHSNTGLCEWLFWKLWDQEAIRCQVDINIQEADVATIFNLSSELNVIIV